MVEKKRNDLQRVKRKLNPQELRLKKLAVSPGSKRHPSRWSLSRSQSKRTRSTT